MRLKDRPVPPRLRRRMCLGCGYQGSRLEGNATFSCPGCGTDLYARPPMSYAEMEGLDLPGDAAHAGPRPARPGRWRSAAFRMLGEPARGLRAVCVRSMGFLWLCLRAVPGLPGRQAAPMTRTTGSGCASGERHPRSASTGRPGSANRA